jgi:hypothetical protein
MSWCGPWALLLSTLVLVLLAPLRSASAKALTVPGTNEYRDFLFKLPTKDYRKKFGQEIYRFPKLKIGFLLHPTSASVSVLKSILDAINYSRHEVDVVFFQQSDVVRGLSVEDLEKVVVVDVRSWSQADEHISAKQYHSLVFIPSEDAPVDDFILSKVMLRTEKLARQSVLMSTHHFVQAAFERWLELSACFDYSIYWGNTSTFRSVRAQADTGVMPSQLLVKILATQEEQSSNMTTSFLNKLFVLVRKLTQLSRRQSTTQQASRGGGVAAVWNLDAVKLARPSEVFSQMEQFSRVYIKASFGYVSILFSF